MSINNLNSTTSSLQTSASNAAQSASNAQDGVDGINATTSALENPTSYDFGPGGSNSTFDLSSAPATPNVTGLYLGSTNLGSIIQMRVHGEHTWTILASSF